MAWPCSVVRFAMKRPGLTALALASLGVALARGADATSPVDLTQRNASYVPAAGATVKPDKQAPVTNTTVQEKRFDTATVEKPLAPQAERRAGVAVQENADKRVRENDSHRPETREQPVSAFNQRQAAIATSTDTAKPPLVAKYQDSLIAASEAAQQSDRWARARAAALDRGTRAKINRFVFQKNPPDPSITTDAKAVTPAAGGAVISK